jgi:hypothetical protein
MSSISDNIVNESAKSWTYELLDNERYLRVKHKTKDIQTVRINLDDYLTNLFEDSDSESDSANYNSSSSSDFSDDENNDDCSSSCTGSSYSSVSQDNIELLEIKIKAKKSKSDEGKSSYKMNIYIALQDEEHLKQICLYLNQFPEKPELLTIVQKDCIIWSTSENGRNKLMPIYLESGEMIKDNHIKKREIPNWAIKYKPLQFGLSELCMN